MSQPAGQVGDIPNCRTPVLACQTHVLINFLSSATFTRFHACARNIEGVTIRRSTAITLTARLTAPRLDAAYGITAAAEGITWPAIEEKLKASRNYWIGTTRSDGSPHSKPVWGVWDDGLWFSTGAKAVTGRNLTRDSRVAVHLESGDDVVILEGSVEGFPVAEVSDAVFQAYADKYAFDPREGEQDPSGVWYRLVPSLAHTWLEHDFQNSVGRWEFD